MADTRTNREILLKLEKLTGELRTQIVDTHSRIDRKIRYAVIGGLLMAPIALLVPSDWRDPAAAMATYASFGVGLGLVLG